MARMHPVSSFFFGFLAVLYLGFIVLASLYPFIGWQITAPNLFGYLFEPFDFDALKYNKLDILFNFIVYIPLGILLVLAPNRLPYWVGAFFAIIVSATLSLSMEALQSCLPMRASSTFDVIWNVSGATLGVILMGSASLRQAITDCILRWRAHFFESGRLIDIGLNLIILWFFVQLAPEGGLFAVGDLELFFPSDNFPAVDTSYFIHAESLVCALNMLALGMVCRCLFRSHQPRVLVLAIFVIALLVRTAGFALYFGLDDAFTWLTPGAKFGLLAGTCAFLIASFLPRRQQFALGGLSLLVAVVAVNFLPMNPYISETIRNWRPGNYVGLAGITRAAAVLWPFLMFSYLYLYRRFRPHPQKRAIKE